MPRAALLAALAALALPLAAEATGQPQRSPPALTIKPTTAYLLELALGPVTEVANILAKRTWTLVEFAEACLFTAENPVVHINPSGESLGFGVVTAEQMYLPVSPTQALLLSHPWSDWPHARVRGGHELAAKLNWAVLLLNRRFLLHPEVETYPLPGVGLLLEDTWWPWGPDPRAKPPAFMNYRQARRTDRS